MHLREGDDALGRVFDLPEIEPQVAPVHQAGERRPVLGADHDLDLQARGRGHEIVGAIGSARDQQQDADHLYKLTTNRMTPMPPAITVTPAALAKIEAVRSKSGHPDACLRIAIAGRRCGQFVYELDLVAPEDAPSSVLPVQTAGLRVRIEAGSAANLGGAVVVFDPAAMRRRGMRGPKRGAWMPPRVSRRMTRARCPR